MKKIPLSVVIIAKNEEERLPDCLKSIHFAEEVIVCDTGSTDSTIRIAEESGATVKEIPFTGYGTTKQTAIEYASHDWILSLDCDERVPSALAAEIEKVITSASPANGYEIPRLTWLWRKPIRHGGWYPGYVLRLIRKGKGKFTPSDVHERIVVEGETRRLSHAIEHHTDFTLPHYLAKLDHFTSLAASEHAEDPRFNVSPLKALSRSVATFFKMYFIKKGWKDGVHGFMLAGTSTFSTFMKYTKTMMIRAGYESVINSSRLSETKED